MTMNPFDGAHAPYVDLNSLATAYGTPLYVYSADGFIASYQGFAASLSDWTAIFILP